MHLEKSFTPSSIFFQFGYISYFAIIFFYPEDKRRMWILLLFILLYQGTRKLLSEIFIPGKYIYFHVSCLAFPISQSRYLAYPAHPNLTSKFMLGLFHGRCVLLHMHLILLRKLRRILPSKASEYVCLGGPCVAGAFLVRFYVETGAYKLFIFENCI